MLKEETQSELALLGARYPSLVTLLPAAEQAVERIAASCRGGGKLLVCGNGGSAADSLHIVGELMKDFAAKRELLPELRERIAEAYPEDSELYTENLQRAVPAISLVNEVSLVTAYGNDRASELAFAQQILGYGRAGDVLLAISTSGNSANVVHAARIARLLGLAVISLTGEGGGRLRELSDILLNVPSGITYQIQELHLPVYHALCLALEKELF